MSKKLTIYHLYPELLNLYGDSGNIITLTKRLLWRGIGADVVPVALGEAPNFLQADIVFIGGGSDREQQIVGEALYARRKDLASYVDAGGVLLAVCGAYQLLGHEYSIGNKTLQGLSIIDAITRRETPRLIGNIVAQTSLVATPIVGYENHGGRTWIGKEVEPFAKVEVGFGNDGESGYEGAHYNHLVATYIHGPLLPKNPELADYLLESALVQKYGAAQLEPLDDTLELQANEYMVSRLLSGKEAQC